MPKIEFTQDYRFAHAGITVVDYTAGQVVEDASEELAEYALRDKVAKRSKAKESAPEKAAMEGAPETK